MPIVLAGERHRSFGHVVAILWLGVYSSNASLNGAQCSDSARNECVGPFNGDLCFQPKEEGLTNTECIEDAAQFQNTMDTHLQQHDFSIAYYGIDDNLQKPDGPNFRVPPSTDAVHLCLSGITGTPSNVTICMNVTADNIISTFGTMCRVALVPNITRGCYADFAMSTSAMPSTTTQNTSPQIPTSMPSESSGSVTPVSTAPQDNNAPANRTSGGDSKKDKADPAVIKDIIVPVIVGVLGLLAAAIGAGFVIRRRRRRDEGARINQINIGPVELHAHLGDYIRRMLVGSSTSPSVHGSAGELAPLAAGSSDPQMNLDPPAQTEEAPRDELPIQEHPAAQHRTVTLINPTASQTSPGESRHEGLPPPPPGTVWTRTIEV